MFPDEIVRLIREFARPLTRRKVSCYWNQPSIKNDEDMLQHVYNKIVDAIELSPWLESESIRFEPRWEEDFKIYVWIKDDEVEYSELVVSISAHHVLNWKKNDEQYHIDIIPYWNEPSFYTIQLINDNGTIVKLIK